MHGHLSDVWSYGMGLSWIWMAVFSGLLIWGAVMLLRLAVGPHPSAGTRKAPAALATLKERYARGELSREQFETMRRDLR